MAAVLVVLSQPWTAVVMLGGIRRLLELSEGAGKVGTEAEVSGLLRAWVGQNWVRAGVNCASGAVGLWAVLSR